jgi:hypothetical protein
MSRKIAKGKSLAEVNPELSEEWHPTLNGDLTPYSVTKGSNKKVWWICTKGDDHVWEEIIGNRVYGGYGCKVCSNRKIVDSNCLKTLRPDLAKQWYHSKNGLLTPSNIGIGSNKSVWWKCPKGYDHVWKASISNRSYSNTGCPFCSGRKPSKKNNLGGIYPDIAKEWHPSKNGKKTPFDYTISSGVKAWWLCSNNPKHEWQTMIGHRTSNKTNCPYCSGRLYLRENSFGFLYPELAKEWHPTKNGKRTPYECSKADGYKAWWKCPKGKDHIWQTMISHRTKNKSGCPFCDGQKIDEKNTLAYLKPNFLAEWHPKKNLPLTPNDIGKGDDKHKIWWICKNNPTHEWQAITNNRNKGRGCPFCDLTPQSRQELTITFELIQFFEINPRGFKTFIDGKMWSIDIYIKELNLGLEFDGNYWHKGKREFDKLKTEQLEDIGFKIIRIREEPLKKIFESDIISKKPYNGKEITNNVLKHIIANYNISNSRLNKIKKYITKKTLQSQQALDEHIEKILVEKVENKKNKKTQYNNGYK